MSRKVMIQLRRIEAILVVSILALGLMAGVGEAQIQVVSVECGSNVCFILCQPNIQSPEDLSAYIQQAHSRLASADQSLVTEAVVTFVSPITFDRVAQYVQGTTATGISIRAMTETGGDLIAAFPFNEEETDSIYTPDTTGNVVSMRLTADVMTLNALSGDANILCVDAGATDQLDQHPNATIIVLEDVYQGGSVGAGGKLSAGSPPGSFSLAQNYPNPFNPVTEISFSLPLTSDVKLEVYNLLGQVVSTIYQGRLEAGHHTYSWDGSDAVSGVYLYKLTAGDFVETRKMVLLK
jgi:hypothetical protein